MPVNLYPPKQAEFAPWLEHLATTVAATASAFGVSTAQAAAMTATNTSFQTLYEKATNPLTRTRGAIADKAASMKAAKVGAKRLADVIRAYPSITPGQLEDLGIPLPASRTPNPPPVSAPGVSVVSVNGKRVRVRLRDTQNPDSRAKPAGCLGATVMSAVSPTQPASIDAFRIEGIATRNVFELIFPEDLADGAKVWLVALWNSTRGQNGPASTPVSVVLSGGTVNALESLKYTPQKKAA